MKSWALIFSLSLLAVCSAAQADDDQAPDEGVAYAVPAGSGGPEWYQKMKSWFDQAPDIGGAKTMVEESNAMNNLRKILVAFDVWMMENDNREPSFEDMVKSGHLEPEFADGEEQGYKFSVNFTGSFTEGHADPIDPKASLRHFYVGEDGTMKAASGGRAGSGSKRAA